MNNQKLFNSIIENNQKFKCFIHDNSINQLCIQSDQERDVFRLMCQECLNVNKQTIDYPLKYIQMLKDLLEEVGQLKKLTKKKEHTHTNERLDTFQIFKHKVFGILQQIGQFIQEIKTVIETTQKEMEITLNMPLPTQKEYLEKFISELADAKDQLSAQESFNYLRQIRLAPHSFQLDFSQIQDSRLQKIVNFNCSFLEEQFYFLSQTQEQLQSTLKSHIRTWSNISQNSIPNRFDIKKLKSTGTSRNCNMFTWIYGVEILDERHGAYLGYQNRSYYVCIFLLEQQFQSVFEIALGTIGCGVMNSNIVKLDHSQILCGVNTNLFLIDFHQFKLLSVLKLKKEVPFSTIEMENQTDFYLAEENGQVCQIILNQDFTIITEYFPGFLKGHSQIIYQIQFIESNQTLVTCSQDQTIRVWSSLNGKNIKTFKCDMEVYSIRLTPNMRNLFFSGASSQIYFIDLFSNGEEHVQYCEINKAVYIWKILYLGDGLVLATQGRGLIFYSFREQNAFKISEEIESTGYTYSVDIKSFDLQSILLTADNNPSQLIQMSFSI